jgi:[ribosomal protein S5]-alanine N-acetyltransferase
LTNRLELISATVDLARAEMNDLAKLTVALGVPLPQTWPPPLNDEHSQRSFLRSLEQARPEGAGWHLWYCIHRQPRALVGSAGFKGAPQNGTVEVGYSMLESHQRNGYCTEAVQALLAWAFAHPEITMVIGHTLLELTPSIRVMEKCGFVFAGEGAIEDGMQTIRYELPRGRFALAR